MEENMLDILKKYKNAILIFIGFETLAVTLGLAVHLFYLFNFTYIGFFVSLGFGLRIAGFKKARLVSMFGIGMYMLVYLGIINRENMQLEGFFYYLATGTWMAAVLHYMVAKIFGPFLFGRGWCGYVCWTAMVLDLLPYKIPKKDRVKKLGLLRIGVFIVSLALFVFIWINFNESLREEYPFPRIMFISFIVGNIIYYAVGILLAIIFSDNRAFCKYICPITVFLKPASYFSLLRVKIKSEKCTSCGKCKKVCPMDVNMLSNKRNRKYGTECILCTDCIKECPKKALSF
jgi:polyferredoxin